MPSRNRLTLPHRGSKFHANGEVFVLNLGGGNQKGVVGMKVNSSATKGNVPDLEFESLLRRASESAKSSHPQLLKSVAPKGKPPGHAA
jgi:hypothetical protein